MSLLYLQYILAYSQKLGLHDHSKKQGWISSNDLLYRNVFCPFNYCPHPQMSSWQINPLLSRVDRTNCCDKYIFIQLIYFQTIWKIMRPSYKKKMLLLLRFSSHLILCDGIPKVYNYSITNTALKV